MNEARHYITLATPYAVAAVMGAVDTLPFWASPPEGVLGQRVALVGTSWHEPTALNMLELHGVKFTVRQRQLSGRVGSVQVMGYVQVANPWDRKGIAGKNWPKRAIPKMSATFHWLLGAPKFEPNSSFSGLTRLLVTYEDRPQYLETVREYGDKYGIGRLPSCDRDLYTLLKGKENVGNQGQ